MYQQQTAFENIMGKGEIARNEQFILFPQGFLLNQKIVSPFVHVFDIISLFAAGVLRSSVLKCLTRKPGVLGSSRTGSSEFFVGVSFGKTLQSPSLVLVKPRKDMNNVSCRRDMIQILLKVA